MNRPQTRRPKLSSGLAAITLATTLGLGAALPAAGSPPGSAPTTVITTPAQVPETTSTTTLVMEPATSLPPDELPTGPGPVTPRSVEDPPLSASQETPSDDQGVGRVVLADGHVDIGPRFINGVFTVQVRDDSGLTDVWRNTEDVVLWAVPASELAVPADPAYAFLGPAGSRSWVLPQTQVPGVIWPGWNTQAESVKAQIPGSVDWAVRGVQGPGTFHLFLSGNFGEPTILFDSTRPFPQTLPIPHNTHTHGNWAFSQPGVYKLDVQFSATTASGTPVSDRRTLSIAVGDVDPNTAFPAPGTPGTGSPDPSAPGGPNGDPSTDGTGSTEGTGSSSTSSGATGSGPNSGSTGTNGAELPNAGTESTVALVALGLAFIAGGTHLVRRSSRSERRTSPPA